jgi:hypothetical protein
MIGPQDFRAQERYAPYLSQQTETERRMNIGPQAPHGLTRDPGPRLGCGIEFQMERLAKNVAAMEERFHALAMKLGPLTRPLPEPTEVSKDTGYSTPAQSPLADQVARLTDQIERLNNGMAYLTDGVDL